MPQSRAIISIENVVATASLGQAVDLELICKNFENIKYDPKSFPGLVFKLKSPKTTTLIFRTGNMVCAGARSEEQAFRAIQNVVAMLKKNGIEIHGEPKIMIQNIVASASLGGRVALEDVARTVRRTIYEPDQFPGVIHRIDEPKTVILIFASGKLVCTGAKKEEDTFRAVNKLHSTLEEMKLITY